MDEQTMKTIIDEATDRVASWPDWKRQELDWLRLSAITTHAFRHGEIVESGASYISREDPVDEKAV